MTETRGQITTARHTLGVTQWPEDNSCNTCREPRRAVIKVNLDGVWTYICGVCRNDLITWLTEVNP